MPNQDFYKFILIEANICIIKSFIPHGNSTFSSVNISSTSSSSHHLDVM